MDKPVPFYVKTSVLDEVMQKDVSQRADLVEAIAKVLRLKPDLYRYFFRNSPHPTWAIGLLAHGFFINAPEIKEEKGNQYVPRWEEQEYLISVARVLPQLAVWHLQNLKGHAFYISRALSAVLSSSPDYIAQVKDLVLKWVDEPEVFRYISLDVLSMANALSDTDPDGALEMLRRLGKPLPPPNLKQVNDYFINTAAVPAFPLEDYQGRTLHEAAKRISIHSPIETVDVIETLLREALQLEEEAQNKPGLRGGFTYWRNTIPRSDDNWNKDYKDYLLDVLFFVLEKAVISHPEEIRLRLVDYLGQDVELFNRIGLALLCKHPEQYRQLTEDSLLKPENINDYGIQNEYFELLQNGFPLLKRPQQEELIHRVLVGPPPNSFAYLIDEGTSNDEKSKIIRDRTTIWSRDRLWMIRSHLDGEDLKFLEDAVAEFGEPRFPSFAMSTGNSFFVSSVSPRSAQELSKMSDAELDHFIRNWRPPANQFGPVEQTVGALGSALAELITGDFDRFSGVICDYALLRPAFASSIIFSLGALAATESRAQTELIVLGSRLLEDEVRRSGVSEDKDSDWRSARWALVEAIKKLVSTEEVALSFEIASGFIDILEILANDPDPDLKTDRPSDEWFGAAEPLTVSINHIRTEALEALISLGCKSRKTAYDTLVARIFDSLAAKVNYENDPSLAVHSVFGRELGRLFWLNADWVRRNLDIILPLGEEFDDTAYFVAAWDSWLLHSMIGDEMFELLRTRYERAIENVSRGLVTRTFNPVRALSHHLLLDHHLRKTDLRKDPNALLAQFFAKTSAEQRAEALIAANQRLGNRSEEWVEVLDLWNWRHEIALAAGFPREFKSEMTALSGVLHNVPDSETVISLWPLLEGLIPYLDKDERWSRIWHNLEEFLSRQPMNVHAEALRFYGMMHDATGEPQAYYSETATKLLHFGRVRGEARLEAIKVIDRINRGGNYQFRALQKELLDSR